MSRTLSPDQLAGLLQQHPAWCVLEGILVRWFLFPTFADAIAFVDAVAALAEQADHHPDIDIRYNRVKLGLISHDVAGLSSRDAAMVRQVDAAFPA